MGIFNIFKKKKVEKKAAPQKTTKKETSHHNDEFVIYLNTKGELVNKNEPDVDLDHLDEDGDFPMGWHYRNREFTGKIDKEFKYFHENWLESRKKSPREQYGPLKSMILYLEDVEKLCKSKGECFELWFNEILSSPGWLDRLKRELKDMEDNMDTLQAEYEKKRREQEERRRKVIEMKPVVIEMLKANDGILQSEFWKLFDDESRVAASDIVYSLFKEGKVEKTKSGRSYILHFKGGDARN